jgi:hypothetical protein
VIWLIAQTGTLALAAARFPLTAHAGTAPGRLALAEMITVQFSVSTLLTPGLATLELASLLALTAVPFLQLAAFLTIDPSHHIAWIAPALAIWIFALRACRGVLGSRDGGLILSAALNLLVIGTPILLYLLSEFSDFDQASAVQFALSASPIPAAIAQAASAKPLLLTFLAPLLLLGAGLIGSLLRRRLARAKLST